ncbi:MAG: hypothetical protein FJW40_17510 [Acidobacteria bacterium]|nr:hypothetical protein [Acidobacteriota bacterium]
MRASLAALLGATLQAANPLPEQVDAIFARFTRETPGCSVAVTRGGTVVYKHGFGLATLEHNVPIGPPTRFYAGSVSKQFTAASAILAAGAGAFDLDAPIARHIPELPPYAASITPRQLIHHTSGLRDYLELATLSGRYGPGFVLTHAEFLAMLARQYTLNFPNGTEHQYSNSGYAMLNVLITRTTGKSLRQFAAERIFTPLRMRSTHFHDDRLEVVPNRALGYSPRDGGYMVDTATHNMVGAGGLFTTVEDLVLWMRSPLFQSLGERGRLSSGKELDYASGVQHGVYRGLATVGHSGGLNGYRAYLVTFPEQGIGITCLCNASNINPRALSEQVADLYLDNAQPQPRSVKPQTVKPVITREPVDRYAGTYHSRELDTDHAVEAKGSVLRVQGRTATPLGPGRYLANGATIEFTPEGFNLSTARIRNMPFRRVAPFWTAAQTAVTASLRGLAARDARNAWATGTQGTVLRTRDGGVTWQPAGPVSTLDFRDVETPGAAVILMSAGPGDASRLYRSADEGATWQEVLRSPEKEGFFDAIAFWDADRGLLLGDPVQRRMFLMRTTDGGRTWARVANPPEARAGEAAFAASGTALVTGPAGKAWFGTGGAGGGRLFRTEDWGATWEAVETPLRRNAASAGIFSLAFRDGLHGIAVGGDYQRPNDETAAVAITRDGGKTWQPGGTLSGFRSAVIFRGSEAFAAGTNGLDVSQDGGVTWRRAADTLINTLAVKEGTLWGAGRALWSNR